MLARDSSVLECLNAGGCFPLYEHRVKLRCLSSCHIHELAGSVGGLTIIAALLASVYMYMYFLLAWSVPRISEFSLLCDRTASCL